MYPFRFATSSFSDDFESDLYTFHESVKVPCSHGSVHSNHGVVPKNDFDFAQKNGFGNLMASLMQNENQILNFLAEVFCMAHLVLENAEGGAFG
mmetsp:Transcript_19342/g.29461  ORF Transcript_19342/g.29461 Transcript_19342/m.29461 type:complete len:94 (+) Transcript_19342:407-688(+)